MQRRLAIRTLMLAGAASFLAGLRADDQDFVIRSEVRLVLLDVSVTDRNGGFVPGLTKDNFRVFENGALQAITVFAKEDLPVTVGIVVDESWSMTPKRGDVISAAETFIEESNPRDEIFVLNFNETVKPGLPKPLLFSDDLEQLRSALYRGIPQGRTALNDAVIDGLKQLEMGRRDKKALMVISDGGDNASRHTRREMSEMVERSIATIYTIGLSEADDPDRNPGILKHMAGVSGGQAYFPASPPEIVAACRGIARDIRTRYTIGYLPPASNGAGPLRHIHVGVSAPGRARLTARTRTRYRYEQAENQSTK
ncbi:MAG TPA: VWA domain-containing protein [Bryobacteraceae bacterium]|nr:VWA domain-containing protein [Bryobacteraceae bacterium]